MTAVAAMVAVALLGAMVVVVLLGRFSARALGGISWAEVEGAVEVARRETNWPCCFRGELYLMAVEAGEEEYVEVEVVVEAAVG